MKYLYNIIIWLDQGLNVLFAGSPDETLSARAYRNRSKQKWSTTYKAINKVFFWQADHCKSAFESEKNRKQLPREYHAADER